MLLQPNTLSMHTLYCNCAAFWSGRDIRTRNHQAVLFRIDTIDFYKCHQDPVYRAMSEWNNLNVDIRNAETKTRFIKMIKHLIQNPYKKIL